MTLPSPDANGIGRYAESTPIPPEFSDYMNLGLVDASAAISADRLRLDSAESRLTALDAWSGWQTPVLGAGWTSDANNPIQYAYLGAVVIFRGVANTAGTTNNMFTLAAGYRPEFASTSGSPVKKFPLVSDNATLERLFIYPNGVVQQAVTAARNGVTLDGVRFRRVP